ncbi:MAG: chemotaxis protein CheB [Streptosporangiaceae bacterium]|jgi:two-component system chemotaxis response regulator CheB
MTTGPGRDLVVVAASAGGLEPLRTLLAGLPADLPAAVLVVLHIPASGGRTLPHILDRVGALPAAAAVDGERLRPSRVYVAPPDRHLLVHNDTVRTSRGPRQNGVRPAADPLFRSAALMVGPRTIAVVLSGTLDDAARGAATVEQRGGYVIVQDPAEASYDSMPRSALATTEHAEVCPVSKLAAAIVRLVGEQAEAPAPAPAPELEAEIRALLAGDPLQSALARDYRDLTCPDCGGPLYHSKEREVISYDCLAGHRWSPQALLEQQTDAVERALWLAIRSLDERGRLTEGLAEAARQRGHDLTAARFRDASKEARLAAEVIRNAANGMGRGTGAAAHPDDPVPDPPGTG